MQDPCRRPADMLRPALALALALIGGTAAATASTPDSAMPALREGALAWAAAQMGVPATTLQLAPMDSRVAIAPCVAGWSFDYPFASRETLRARCNEPSSQYFLRLVGLNRPAASAATGPTAGSVPAAPGPGGQTAAPAAGAALPAAGAPTRAVALVLIRDLPRGARLGPELVSTVETEPNRLDARAPRDPRELIHAELVRDLRAGQPLRGGDLRPATLVRRGQMVTYTVGEQSRYRISARLEAMQDGIHGDRIRLRNPESGRIVTGRVTAENTVEFN